MWAAGRAIVAGLNDVRIKGYTYIWANLAFVALSLPLVTVPAAFSALCRVAHAAHTDQHHEADLDLFWQTFKAQFWRALPWGLAHLAFAVVTFSNLITYAGATDPLWVILWGVWLLMTLGWGGVVLYTWFLYYEMEQPDLLTATRNACIMVLLNPGFTLTLAIAIILLAALSTVLIASWLLLTWGAIASIGAAAVLSRLAVFREKSSKDGVR